MFEGFAGDRLPFAIHGGDGAVRELDGAQRLLQGARGAAPVNLDAVAEAIARLADTALSLTGALRALEVNPLWVNGDQVEALDVLVVTEREEAR